MTTNEQAVETANRHLRRMENMRIISDLWVWLGLACIATTIGYWFDPTYARLSVVGQFAGPWESVWVHGFGLSGLLLLAGIFLKRLALEAAGLIILASALIINWIALLVIQPATTGVMILPALILTAMARYYVIVEKSRMSKGGSG